MATRYTFHATQRMAERNITTDQVDQVLAKPDGLRDDPDQRSVRLHRQLPEGELRVWVVAPWPEGDRVVVKSVAWKD